MNVVLTVAAVMYVLTAAVQKFSMVSILSLVSTCLFLSRKIGHFCKIKTLLGLEIVGLFLDTVYKCMFSKFSWLQFLPTVLLRLVFIGIAYYDMTVFVYVKEKHRKGEKEDLW